ncbi:hypothetical protein AAC387_Pa03g3598 [Persea americana]
MAYKMKLLDNVKTSDVFNIEDLTMVIEDASAVEAIDDEDANSRPSYFQLGENNDNQEEAQIQASTKNVYEQVGDNLIAHEGSINL